MMLLRFLAREKTKYTGIVRMRELPDNMDIDTFKHWWLPERNSEGVEIRKPRMSAREKDRYTVLEHKNCLTIDGKSLLLSYMSLASGAQPFAAYFAVGSGYCSGVSANDKITDLAGEFYRSLTTGFVVQGDTTDIATYMSSLSAIGNFTNAALIGGSGATATLGTGLLSTHTRYVYTKGSLACTNDYLITQA